MPTIRAADFLKLMDETTKTNEAGTTAEVATRNPVILILGFAVLGIAAGLILFGGSLFGGEATVDVAESSILEQVSELEPADPAINQIPGGSLGGLEVGEAAPDFTVQDLDGNAVKLSDYRGKPVILNFWATWCAPCRVEMPEFQAVYEKNQDIGLEILAVNRDETREQVVDFFDEFGLTFTPLLDQGALVAEQYQVFNMPTTYFLDENGVVTAVHRGPLVSSQLDGYLEQTIGDS